jgi:hypothetical protein
VSACARGESDYVKNTLNASSANTRTPDPKILCSTDR